MSVWGAKDGRTLHKRLARKWEQWTSKWEPLLPDSLSAAFTSVLIPVSGGFLTLFLLWGLLRTVHIRTVYAESQRSSESKQVAALLDHAALPAARHESSRLAGDVGSQLLDRQGVELIARRAGKKPSPSDQLWSENAGTEGEAGNLHKLVNNSKLKVKKKKKKSSSQLKELHRKARNAPPAVEEYEFGSAGRRGPSGTSNSSGKRKNSVDKGTRKVKAKKRKPHEADMRTLLNPEGDVSEEMEGLE